MPKKRKKRDVRPGNTPENIRKNVFEYLTEEPDGVISRYLKAGYPKIGTTTFHSYKKKFYDLGLHLEEAKKNEEKNTTMKDMENENDFLKWKLYGIRKGWLNPDWDQDEY